MRFPQFLTFYSDGKNKKNHTATVWLVMVLIWLVILLKNRLNFTKYHVFKNVAARKYPWFFVRNLFRHKSNKRPVYAGFSCLLNRVLESRFAEYLRPPPFFTAHTWKRLRPLVAEVSS